MMADSDSQSEALRIEQACGPGDVHNAKQFAIGRIVDRDRSTGPALHLRAKMLSAPDLNGFRFRDRSADSVGSNVGLAPASSMFQVNRATGVNDPVIALGIDDQAAGICEDHDRICI